MDTCLANTGLDSWAILMLAAVIIAASTIGLAVLKKKNIKVGFMVLALMMGFVSFAPQYASAAEPCNSNSNPTSPNASDTAAAPDAFVQGFVLGMTVDIDILANDPGMAKIETIDIDPRGQSGVQQQLTTSGGDWEVLPNGHLQYSPKGPGIETISYQFEDQNGQMSNITDVTVTLTGNDMVARDDAFTTIYRNGLVSDYFNVLQNDDSFTLPNAPLYQGAIDLDLATPGVQGYVNAGGVELTVDDDYGDILLESSTITSGYTFQYQFIDADGNRSNTATVTVTITVPEAPVANNDSYTLYFATGGGGADYLDVLANDTTDPASGLTNLEFISPFVGGSELSFWQGKVQVDTSTAAASTSQFQYYIIDEFGQQSNTATVTVTFVVGPVAARHDTMQDITCPLTGPYPISIIYNDQFAAGKTLDPTSVDIDQSTPGVQQTLVRPGYTLSYDQGTEILTVTITGSSIETIYDQIRYRFSSTDGDVSNWATVNIDCYGEPQNT